MKALLVLLTVALFGIGIGAAGCGDTSKGGTTTVSSVRVSAGGYLKKDGDIDFDDNHRGKVLANDDIALLASSGPEADAADRSAVTAVVKRYYAAAAAENGAQACLLLDSSLAAALAVGGGRQASSGKTCAGSLSAFYKQQHEQLADDEVATMAVTDVHIKGGLGLAVLGFRKMPEGEILLEREDGVWKIDSLLDSEMP
jgi:hypothetical protein